MQRLRQGDDRRLAQLADQIAQFSVRSQLGFERSILIRAWQPKTCKVLPDPVVPPKS